MTRGLLISQIHRLYKKYQPLCPLENEIIPLLDSAYQDFEAAFDEKDQLWQQYLLAESGETGDYPDLVLSLVLGVITVHLAFPEIWGWLKSD